MATSSTDQKLNRARRLYSYNEYLLNKAHQVLLHRLQNNTLSRQDKSIIIDCLCQHGLVTLKEVEAERDSGKTDIEPVNDDSKVIDEVLFTCKRCSQNFSQKDDLKRHVKNCHKTIQPIICEVCEKTFSQLWLLEKHLKVHSKERLFACRKCGKEFKVKSELSMHRKIHENERRYKCTECESCFYRTVEDLEQHA
ncbi:uncharacterized protein LOC144434414 [Glandiceps talaboti]